MQEPAAKSHDAVMPRRRLSLRGELALALGPTITVLLVFALVEAWSHQRLLFASLASSAFLIYLEPRHTANTLRTLLISQVAAALVGFAAFMVFGPDYTAAAIAMLVIIALMIGLNAMHPPAVSTALGFAFASSGRGGNLILFGVALILILALVGLQRFSVWLLDRYESSN